MSRFPISLFPAPSRRFFNGCLAVKQEYLKRMQSFASLSVDAQYLSRAVIHRLVLVSSAITALAFCFSPRQTGY